MTKRRPFVFLCWLIPIIFGIIIYHKGGLDWEFPILSWTTSRSELTFKFFKIITFLGNTLTTILIWTPVGVILYQKDRNLFYGILLVFLLSVIHIVLFKNFFQRIRPLEFMKIQQGGYSYPSGHSLTSIACYFTLARFLKNKNYRVILKMLAILIGISRLFVGVHWPTDVLMGFMLGYFIYQIGVLFILQRKELGDIQ